ncbi:MAG: glutamine--tRNA ligase/YqeY domain fusion protein [Oscillospiraceae bacterium]|jgi:glutaminyl-tRNA synthetase
MSEESTNFLMDIISEDVKSGTVKKVHTRFPPEPNGYLHIGSAKAIWINYSAAKKFGGLFNLRFDDTNPVHEDMEYVDSIIEDIRWLGCEPDGGIFYGSDYFDKCYEFAVQLIKDGKAYVDELSQEEMKEYRGTLTEPGKNSPYRDRPIEESLDLFERMKNGEFPNGAMTLRAKIDMASPNMNLRDPPIYRIIHSSHQRQGDKWCIYPLYDYAHPIQDALEGITHSMCSIEFENHRPLYEWVINNVAWDGPAKPHLYPKQREFARLNVTYTVMSKRYLRELVETGVVDGWDDPRMPTLRALRRRGYTPSSIIKFLEAAGVAKAYSIVDIELLEHFIRDELNESAPRRMAVLDPIKLTVENYPEGKTEYFDVPNNPKNPDAGTREVAFTRSLYIERSDFEVTPPPKYHRLTPGSEVRLMGAYAVTCTGYRTDADGNVTEVTCRADLETGGKNPPDGRKIKGTIHWVSCEHGVRAEVRDYDRLFTIKNTADIPDGKTFGDYLNANSVKSHRDALLEESLSDAPLDVRYQFVRNGYYIRDSKNADKMIFVNVVSLKDSWKPPEK